mmetsp:Transcript_12556/g.22457  ORF Transcript_12556/g.22457 Transcript_12556/m.22457 type:complete len:300 (-) Transcript_12556:1098-1997(-)|eukprot:CAMPEP_0175044524 /NCGR_PEP_ID=MMETSP0052_2-20121109/3864_1 /TAXON_ID=51329 ORGANISM="Polytomella parva, Strain SAG 63-3" /NCGR_SAMPLE_ID=MMETSP0052_2 /ASSEMBLY_ACC=CAM_ASM_000194 /LENGTH=299 /DNA_ID=CAMNT_0016307851 /DNA_START=17 /DNA_END=916 /DNA_ORIENTATION=+
MAEESPVDVQAETMEDTKENEVVTSETNVAVEAEPNKETAPAPESNEAEGTGEDPPAEATPDPVAADSVAADSVAPPSASEPGQNDDQIPAEAQEGALAPMTEQQFESNAIPTTYTATSEALVKNELAVDGDDESVQKSNMLDYQPSSTYGRNTGMTLGSTNTLNGGRSLTFTGPPTNHRAKPHSRSDFSHNAFETLKITNDNIKLCNRLVEISKAPPALQAITRLTDSGHLAPSNVAAATINRSKANDLIAQENLRLYKRLQAVKPSKDISRDGLAREYKTSKGYSDNVRRFREGSST